MNSKLHAVCDGEGRPLVLLLSEGQMSDHKGARLMLDALPPASALIGDRGYDSNWFREALAEKGIEPCIPPTKNRKTPIGYDKALYRQRHRVGQGEHLHAVDKVAGGSDDQPGADEPRVETGAQD